MSIEAYKQIQKNIKDETPELAALNSTSKVSVFNLWIYIVAFLANTIKDLLGVYKEEVNYLLDTQTIASENRIKQVVLDYRHGHPFDGENFKWLGDYSEQEILLAKIVKRAAIQSTVIENRKQLYIKVATEDSEGKLTRIDDDTLEMIAAYMRPNMNAGTYVQYFSDAPDQLRIEIDVYINNQVLLANGQRVDGSDDKPIFNACQSFLADENFNFKGEFIRSLLVDKIQQVDGIKDRAVNIKKVEANTLTPPSWEPVSERYLSKSGYFELLEENLVVNYIVVQ